MWHNNINLYCVSLIGCLYLSYINCFVTEYNKVEWQETHSNPEKPLILSPLIKQGNIKEAQTAAEVKFGDFQGIENYAGYLTVSERYNSNLFFWFFPSKNDYENAPVILWLQGGPAASSLYGLFVENGPFQFIPEENCDLKLRNHSWSIDHSVLYIDNPVGTGFSFTDDDGYTKNETIIGEHLYEALLQFQLFPELQKNDFFITGESYAGKYVPAVSYTIHKNNPLAKQKINLQGLAIGNGWSDPEHQLGYADLLYQLGFLDSNTKTKMQEIANQTTEYIQQKDWQKATDVGLTLMELFQNVSGFENNFNYLLPRDPSEESNKCLNSYLHRVDVMRAIHVGNVIFTELSLPVQNNLREDMFQSITPWISTLLSHYRTLFYNGQLDVIVAYPLTVNFLNNLNFSGADVYQSAPRHQWFVGEELAGYVKDW